MSVKNIREEKIIFSKGDIQDGVLRDFRMIYPGALEVYLVLRAYSSNASRIAKVPISKIRKATGFQFNRILDIHKSRLNNNFLKIYILYQINPKS